MSDSARSVIIVGAGIIGSACARELAGAGWSVEVVDAVGVAAETSCRAMGWVGVYDESEVETQLCRFALACWAEVAPLLPPNVGYSTPGALWIAETDSEVDRARRKIERMRRAGVRAEWVDRDRLRTLEPALKSGFAGAVWVPDDVVLDAPEATRYLAEEAARLGARFRMGVRVRRLREDGIELEGGGRLGASRIVLAAGWQSPVLVPELPMTPRKGTILRTGPASGLVRHQLAELGHMDEVRAGAEDSITLGVQPRSDGALLLGTSRQSGRSDLRVEPEVVERIRERVERFVPALARMPIERSWAGVRPAGPDERPIIGPWPEHPSWIVATAHEGIGITTSIATGKLVREILDGTPPSLPLGPFLPDPRRWARQ